MDDMIPIPDPIVEDSALILISFKAENGDKRVFQTCLSTEDAEEIEALAKKKTIELGRKVGAILRKKGKK